VSESILNVAKFGWKVACQIVVVCHLRKEKAKRWSETRRIQWKDSHHVHVLNQNSARSFSWPISDGTDPTKLLEPVIYAKAKQNDGQKCNGFDEEGPQQVHVPKYRYKIEVIPPISGGIDPTKSLLSVICEEKAR
jgi:hypothetical protein